MAVEASMILGLAPGSAYHGHRLACRVVVQTQDDQIGLGHQCPFGFGVLAALGGNAQQAHLGHVRQTFADLQTGGAGFAVDEHGRHVGARLDTGNGVSSVSGMI